jgi:hypothetical protein
MGRPRNDDLDGITDDEAADRYIPDFIVATDMYLKTEIGSDVAVELADELVAMVRG